MLLSKDLHVLKVLLSKYKSNREQYAAFYEKELFDYRHRPLNLLQVCVENSVPVWHKYLQRANIYVIDNFDKQEPDKFSFLNQDRTFWTRCDIDNEDKIKSTMKEIWKNPRFDIIIDSSNNFGNTRYNYLKRYSIGKYYIEEGDEVRIK